MPSRCDVDWARGAESFKRFPGAAKFKDFRQMLDKKGEEIVAIEAHRKTEQNHPFWHGPRESQLL